MKSYVVALAAAVLLAGCSGSVSVGGPKVDKADLEEKVAGQITGADADKLKVACEGDLKGEKGETQDCVVSDGAGGESLVRAEATDVDGKTVHFETKLYIAADDVASAIEKQLTSQGQQVDSVTCAEDLPGVVDAEVDCSSEPGGDLIARTTAVDGLRVNFNFGPK